MSAPTRERFATGAAGPPAKGKPGQALKDGDAGADAPAKKSKLKSRKVVIGLVAVLAIGGGVGYKVLVPVKVGPPTGGEVVALDPTTLNLAGGSYLRIAISIQLVAGKASATSFFTSRAAELVIDEFSDRSVASLSSNAARQRLTAELTTKIQKAYPGEVYDVFVTQFVTQ